MAKKQRSADMPFLDHLEELRWRILWSLLALAVFTGVGFFLVQHFDVLAILKLPIAPFLPEGRLFVTRPTDAFIITLKLALAVGVVLASPVIFAQIWAFVAPALYEHERRTIVPALIAGLGLFLVGGAMAYLWVLPAVLGILFSFQYEYLEFIITADAYFSFATQLILAFGLLFELPLVMVLLASLDLISAKAFAKQRPIALVIAAIAAAMLTPPDALSMLMLMIPVALLYEMGILLARIVERRRRSNTIGSVTMLLIVASLLARPLQGQEQERPPQRPDTAAQRQDSVPGPVDTATARSLGLPTAPTRSFPVADSVIQELLRMTGYSVLRYAADSITLHGATKEIVLSGKAVVEREGSTLEADSISFLDSECRLLARGDPTLFDRETVLLGAGMRYDTCERRGIVAEALTSFVQSGVKWYLRGGLEVDSASTRIYGESTDVSSCDLPMPHYHFAASSVKWVTNTIMVARPAVLYVRDVPVLWLPFIFQDMRRGRRSGLLVPRFGFSDLVRPNAGYRRHVSNIGYYFVINDYTDLEASLDWFSGNYVSVNGQFRYRWINRFVSGGIAVSRIFESGVEGQPGDRSLRLQWQHQQSFDMRTRLTASVDYATSARVVQQNTVDPFVQTATLGSRLNFNKRYDWGTLTLGGTRTQDLSNGTITQSLPDFSLSPAPIDVTPWITWSPGISVSSRQTLNQTPGIVVPLPPLDGQERADTILTDSRTTGLSIRTPLRIGRWNWVNDFRVTDVRSTRPPPPVTLPDPNDTTQTVTRYYGEEFTTEIDWNTGINLPILLSSTWKLQPTLGIANSTSRAFLLRNRFTNGQFVSQGKRLTFGASISPTLFGFFPGVGPLSRIRHAISPRVTWSYAPAADVPEAYARALDPTGSGTGRRSPTLHTMSFQLSQTFEGKLRPPPGDTTSDPRNARKIKLLSIQTSGVQYDFEQAKEEGRTGWQTAGITNQFTSDLLPGFSISMSHDLWDGPVGTDSARFDPFLRSVSARFSLSGNTLKSLLALILGGAQVPQPPEAPGAEAPPAAAPLSPLGPATVPGTGLGPRPGLDPSLDRPAPARRGRGFQASVTFDDRRTRQTTGDQATSASPLPGGNRTLGFATSFQPTANWTASWNTQYNLTTKEFGQHVLRLERDMHRWRATFQFIKAPNGNFGFNFFISLLDQPDIKFQYDQRTVKR
ncbi:MAG: twin-arginine translocase subunit TatC [Gemmatimonadales bacterium]